MSEIPISGLIDGADVIVRGAQVAFEQNNVTFRGSVRPNPVRQINVMNQAQLEAELGPNLEIPDGEGITIVCDDAFILTKPFKIGLNSFLEILYGL